MNEATSAWPAPPSPLAVSDWFDPLEEAVRGQVRWFIQQLLEEELEAALGAGPLPARRELERASPPTGTGRASWSRRSAR